MKVLQAMSHKIENLSGERKSIPVLPETPPKELERFLLAMYFLEKRRCAICRRRDIDKKQWCKKRKWEFYERKEPKRRRPDYYIENCKMRKTPFGPMPICHRANCLKEHRSLKKFAQDNGYCVSSNE